MLLILSDSPSDKVGTKTPSILCHLHFPPTMVSKVTQEGEGAWRLPRDTCRGQDWKWCPSISLTHYWLEFNQMTRPNCKGRWEL